MQPANFSSPISSQPQRVIAFQDKVTVYEQPSADASILIKIDKGTAFNILPMPSTPVSDWLFVETLTNVRGFVKATTKMVTTEQLLAQRMELQQSIKMGRTKMLTGAALCLVGFTVTVITYLWWSKNQSPAYLWYGAIFAGAGQFLWGMEQSAFARRALREFDANYPEVITTLS